ncbi:WapI family immunity protein [Larkinella sp. VNQ87]|uniref:WapI family immunity protein n=1 Tax=Larkinella sp. VNQ87 TaxID=3400921 RepID=UPI003C0EBE3F
MKLTGPESSFELDILDYEYSDSQYFMDRNWLLISLKTRYKNYVCTTTAPLLSTWEIELLIKWMRSVVAQRQLSPRLSFVEPCLGFTTSATDANGYAFGIKLDQEATPDWYNDSAKPFWLSVNPNTDELQQAIQDLEGQLNRFPVRD